MNLQLRFVQPTNKTDVNSLLSKFLDIWHTSDENMKHLALEKSLNQLHQHEEDLVWSKVEVALPFVVQSYFDYKLLYDGMNGFHALVHLKEPNHKDKGGMTYKTVLLMDYEV